MHRLISHVAPSPPNQHRTDRRRKESPSHIVLALEIKDSAFTRGPNVGTVRHRLAAKYKIVSPNTGYRVRSISHR